MPFAGTEVLRYAKEGRKAHVTLDRPEAMNALNAALSSSLVRAMEAIDADDDVLVAILSGEGGRAFSAGADLKETAERDAAGGRKFTGATSAIPHFAAIRDCRKPVIAAIDGYCIASGLEISLLCDIRVATVNSQFGLPEPRRSLLAGPGLHYLSRTIPLGEAMLMQLTGSTLSAERAYQIGLVQRLAQDRQELMSHANAIADDILLGAPLAVQAIKRVVRVARNVPPEYSEHFAAPIEEVVYASEDRLEGPKAFAENREPTWKGR
jgi:enoyl-CoA hydratase/carnithine racemase